MIYLASPYTHADPSVREARFQAVCRQAAEMMRRGVVVFSPIAHSHAIAAYGLPIEWAFWERFDRVFLERCDEVWVLALDGWSVSRGVQAEIAMARELGNPVLLINTSSRSKRSELPCDTSPRSERSELPCNASSRSERRKLK